MRCNGFTLVELLVVITLLAFAAGAVMLTFGGSGEGAHDSAVRFASRLAAARDEAIVSGRPVSAWVSASGYGFDRLEGERWVPIAHKPLTARDWPDGLELAANREQGMTRVRFDSLGLPNAPLRLRLTHEGRSAEVRLGASGDVAVQ